LHLTKKGLKPHGLSSMMKRIQTSFKTRNAHPTFVAHLWTTSYKNRKL
jgi:hypothetical protein